MRQAVCQSGQCQPINEPIKMTGRHMQWTPQADMMNTLEIERKQVICLCTQITGQIMTQTIESYSLAHTSQSSSGCSLVTDALMWHTVPQLTYLLFSGGWGRHGAWGFHGHCPRQIDPRSSGGRCVRSPLRRSLPLRISLLCLLNQTCNKVSTVTPQW